MQNNPGLYIECVQLRLEGNYPLLPFFIFFPTTSIGQKIKEERLW